ncbi:hypothetical protein ACFJI0_02325 [Hydrogenophaga sp. UC242_53]|uniref:hypothetical protein n=1 Tax=Hydrogenophaga sp. UC242_53 TaxID=3350170 RepID=UPI0036D2A8AF
MDRLVSLGDALLGRGEHAVTVPPMDGALQPNQALEAARSAQAVAAPDNLVRWDGHLCHSSGDALYRVEAEGGVGVRLKSFGAEITCLAALDGATLVVGLDDGRLLLEGGPSTGREIGQLGGYRAACPTAVLALDEHRLVVAEGSACQRCSAWRRDLMAGEKSGAVWLLDLRQASARCLARGLAFPNGLARTADGGVAVSESWRHRLLKLPLDGGAPTVLLADLPGYPGRLSPAAGGAQLAVRVRTAQPAGGVCAARAEVPAPHDGRGARGFLGGACAVLRARFQGAAAGRSDQVDGHPQALGAHPFVRAGGAAGRWLRAGVEPAQPGRWAAARHHERAGMARRTLAGQSRGR